jgi:hypothetical protein
LGERVTERDPPLLPSRKGEGDDTGEPTTRGCGGTFSLGVNTLSLGLGGGIDAAPGAGWQATEFIRRGAVEPVTVSSRGPQRQRQAVLGKQRKLLKLIEN